MCTLTFIDRDNGYYLAMNRDERTSRGVADPPTLVDLGGSRSICPRDHAGGTWIAANEQGIAFALLNWNDVQPAGVPPTASRSRGLVIPALVSFSSHPDVDTALRRLDLKDTLPFRLIGVFPGEAKIVEWRLGGKCLESEAHSWDSRSHYHWFSSSLSDKQASALRGAACENEWDENGADAGSLPWLRKLHASHANGPGPFSVCVHRESVATLSYTEIVSSQEKVECNYFSGSPCTMTRFGCSVKIERKSAAARE
jgi:hypothetical protein